MQTVEIIHTPVVVGFSDYMSPIEPAWSSTHRATLPVAGKSVIVYLIEQLREAGYRHLRIAGSVQQFAVRKRLGNGAEWGLTIRYSDLHGADLLDQTLAEFGNCLYVTGDELHLADFRPTSADSEPSSAQEPGRNRTGFWRPDGHRPPAGLTGIAYACNPLARVSDYHRANREVAAGYFDHLDVPGSHHHDRATVDWQTSVAANAYLGCDIFVGKHCRVGRLARLENGTVVSGGAVIADGVRLSNVCVLPNCYVGPKLRLRDAVVTQQGIFALDGRYWPIDDERILGPTRDNGESVTGIPSLRAWPRHNS